MLEISNGYLLNHALLLAKKYDFFNHLSRHQIDIFSMEISRIGDSFDCILGEVFNKIGGELVFCYVCKKNHKAFINDIFETCDNKIFGMDDDEKDNLLSQVQKLKIESRRQERLRIAKRLIKNGIDLQIIRNSTGLSEAEFPFPSGKN